MSILKSLDITSEKAVEKTEEFLTYSKEYYKLKIFQVLTSSLSLIFSATIIGVFMLIAFIFLAISTSQAISNYLNNELLGHVAVAFIFILFALTAFLARHRIENLVIKSLAKKYFDNEDTI